MADSELIVRLRGENSDLKSKLAEVTNASKTSANSMASNFKSSLGTIASAIGITFSVAAIINFGKQSVMAFAETERAAVSLKNVISNMGGTEAQGGGMVNMADSLERMSGFDDADIMGALQELTVQTGSGAKASAALAVAMDVAAARGISLKEAGNQVFMVMSGLSRSMRQFGMTTRDGATDMDYLRELGTKMAGGLATNLGVLDGRLRITTNAFDNLKEAIGSTLAVSVTAGGGMIANLLNGISGIISSNAVFATMFGTAIGDKDRALMQRLGNQYGQAWLNGYADVLSGKTVEHDVGWAASITPPADFGNAAPKVIGTGTGIATGAAAGTAMAKAFQASWSPINLMGGNLPELTKYIGNLRQVSTATVHHKVVVDVQMTVTGGKVTVKNTTPVAQAIAKVVAPAVQAVITHGQGWTPPTAIGGGLGAGFQFGGG